MGSHYTPLAQGGGDETASLGLYYDHRFEGPGAKIIDYLPIGPAARAGSKLRPGAIILTVNGKAIEPNSDIHTLLNHAAGNPLRLTIQPADGGAIVEEIVTPEPYINSLIHSNDRWVSQNAELVEKLSGGRLGYVHIATMLTPDYQGFYSDLFGKYADREGVVVDVRFNGGGNLSDRLISDLSAKSFGKSVDRDGNPIADVPAIRWTKPSILLANAFSYSDGSIFPHLYKESKLGTFIGEPVPGTGTSVWWVDLLPGKRFTYGIPEIGRKMPDGRFYENTEDSPDIIIRRNPDAIEQGRDEQLEAAVSTLLQQLKKP
jgi:tricorn protease